MNLSTEMEVEGEYHASTNQNYKMIKSKSNSMGRNFPCPEETCLMTFASEPEMQRHLVTGKHLTKADFDKEPGGQAATARDVMKKKWLEGLSGQVAGRKRGNLGLNYTRTFLINASTVVQAGLSGEVLIPAAASTPQRGWALKERTTSARLHQDSKQHVTDLFNAGKLNPTGAAHPRLR